MQAVVESAPSSRDLAFPAVLTNKRTVGLYLQQFISDTHVVEVIRGHDECLSLARAEDWAKDMLLEESKALFLLALHGATAHFLEHLTCTESDV